MQLSHLFRIGGHICRRLHELVNIHTALHAEEKRVTEAQLTYIL
jgi:hypothetical protein